MDKLKYYLEKYGIPIAEFARRINKSRITVHAYLNGSRKPSQEAARDIERETDGIVREKDLRPTEELLCRFRRDLPKQQYRITSEQK